MSWTDIALAGAAVVWGLFTFHCLKEARFQRRRAEALAHILKMVLPLSEYREIMESLKGEEYVD